MSVYTVRLFASQLPATWGDIYTVPAGASVVLRDLEIETGSASSAPLLMSISLASGGSAIWFARPNLPALTSVQWEGRVALSPGDQVWANAGVGNIGAVLTGYLFPYTPVPV